MRAACLCRIATLLAAMSGAWPVLAANDAAALVGRVMTATRSLNYDGVFVYQRDTQVDAMRIIHRAQNGVETERLISLSGPAREVIRDGKRVTCTFADDKAVMVQKRQPSDFFTLGLTRPVEALAEHYDFAFDADDRVAGRHAEVVRITPRGPDRYGYRLWIDAESNLLLKSVILARDEQPLEQVQFTQIQIGHYIPDDVLAAEMDGIGYTWYANEEDASGAFAGSAPGGEWTVAWLPEGFEMKNSQVTHTTTSKMPVSHLVYSDGLAIVSVFVEKLTEGTPPLQGYSSMGAVNAFSRVAEDFQITVVGELPQPTVRQIASSIALRKH